MSYFYQSVKIHTSVVNLPRKFGIAFHHLVFRSYFLGSLLKEGCCKCRFEEARVLFCSWKFGIINLSLKEAVPRTQSYYCEMVA